LRLANGQNFCAIITEFVFARSLTGKSKKIKI